MIEQTAGATVITGPHIRLYQLLVWKHAIKLEGLGMRHSSGRSTTAMVKKALGFKGNRAKVLAQLEDYIGQYAQQANEEERMR